MVSLLGILIWLEAGGRRLWQRLLVRLAPWVGGSSSETKAYWECMERLCRSPSTALGLFIMVERAALVSHPHVFEKKKEKVVGF